MRNTVSDRVLLQEAIVAAWAKEGRDVSMQFTLAGIAADVAMAALSARVAKLEAALRFYAEKPNYRFQSDAEGNLRSPRVNEDDGVKARAALEEPRKGNTTEAAEEDKP